MDVKRPRDPDEVAEDDAAARAQGFPYFSLLPPDVQLNILLQRNLSVKEMHKRCNLYAGLRALCEDRRVWKTKFIERNVKRPGDTRDPRKHEQWADEPRVQEWDRDIQKYLIHNGYVHLVADHIKTVVKGGRDMWLTRTLPWGVTWQMTISHQTAATSVFEEGFNIMATADIPLSGRFTHIAQQKFADWKSNIPMDRYRKIVRKWFGDTFYVHDYQAVAFIAWLLENDFTYLEGQPKLVNACVTCAAPATLQCAHCNDLYCSIGCARAE